MPLTLSGNGTISDLASAPTVGGTALPTNLSDLGIANHDQITVDSSGRMTNSSQPVVNARLSTSQSIDNQTRVKVNFNTIDDQNGSNYSTVNQRFTAPVTGYYSINTHVYIYNAAKAEVYFYKNGSLSLRMANMEASGNVNPNGAFLNHIVKLTEGDYVEIWAYQTSGSTQTIYTSSDKPTYLSIMLIG